MIKGIRNKPLHFTHYPRTGNGSRGGAEGAERGNKCPVAGCCANKAKRWHLLCPEHWAATPRSLQDEVWRTYKECKGSEAHLAAIRAVLAFHADRASAEERRETVGQTNWERTPGKWE